MKSHFEVFKTLQNPLSFEIFSDQLIVPLKLNYISKIISSNFNPQTSLLIKILKKTNYFTTFFATKTTSGISSESLKKSSPNS